MINQQQVSSLNVLKEQHAVDTSIYELPSNIIKTYKTADPSVFPVLKTTHDIIDSLALPWQELAPSIGVIVTGNAYPKHFTQKVIQEIKDTSRVSPLSFINANAGAAISICCTLYKFQGPTINFTMSAPYREQAMTLLATQWLANKSAQYIFMVVADVTKEGKYSAWNRLVNLSR